MSSSYIGSNYQTVAEHTEDNPGENGYLNYSEDFDDEWWPEEDTPTLPGYYALNTYVVGGLCGVFKVLDNHALNVLQLKNDTISTGRQIVYIHGGFPKDATGIDIEFKKGEDATGSITVASEFTPRIIEEDIFNATIFRTIECVVDVSEDAIGKFDIILNVDDIIVDHKMENVLEALKSTTWLVTHDPVFEKNYAQKYPERYKHASLMGNEAHIYLPKENNHPVWIVKPSLLMGDYYLIEKDIPDKIIGDWKVYIFKTDSNDEIGADTDSDGAIYINKKKLKFGPGDYVIKAWSPGMDEGEFVSDITIGPIMTDWSFLPNILPEDEEEPQTFCPYTDEFDISNVPFSGQWFGMRMDYDLDDDVTGCFEIPTLGGSTAIKFDKAPDASSKVVANMPNPHYLVMDDSLLEAQDPNHYVKWEGFNGLMEKETTVNENAQEIFMQADDGGNEAEIYITPAWGPEGGYQHHRGAAPTYVVAEGMYIMTAGVKRTADKSQKQYYQFAIEVEYLVE